MAATAAAPARARSPAVWCLVAATGAAMGVSVPLAKQAGLHGIGPLTFALWPAAASAVVLALWAWFLHGAPPQRGRLAAFGLAAGLLGVALPNVLVAWVSGRAGSGITGVAYALPPAFTLLLALAVGLERLRWPRLAAVALAVTGAGWLATSRVVDGHLSIPAALVLLLLPLSLAGGNVYRAMRLPPGVPAPWLAAAVAVGASAWLVPAWGLAPGAVAGFDPAGIAYLVAQGVAVVLASLLYFTLQRRADALTMSFIGFFIAITAAVLGAVWLGESLPWQLAPAALLIAAGMVLLQRHPARPGPAAR